MGKIKNTVMKNGKRYVCKIWDNAGTDKETLDRFSVFFRAKRDSRGRLYYPYIESSCHPFAPQGFGQHGETECEGGPHLGKRVAFEDVPEDVQKFIMQNLGA